MNHRHSRHFLINWQKKIFRGFIVFAIILLSFSLSSASELSFYIYDSPSRSVTEVVDSSGAIKNKYSYDASGNIASITGEIDNIKE